MRIQLEPLAPTGDGTSSQSPSPATRQAKQAASNSAKTAATTQLSISSIGIQGASISFRQDANGRVYYVVTDSQSGKEIQELPASAVRAIGQTIEAYLQNQKGKQHISLKG